LEYKTFFLSFFEVDNIYKLVIKYSEFVGITKSENDLLLKTDVEAWKRGYQIGLGTLVVHALNDEY